jgi:hypothetical protein
MKGLLQKVLDEGRQRVQQVIAEIDHEYSVRQDIISRPDKIGINVWPNKEGVSVKVANRAYGLTDWSMGQMLNRACVPSTYFAKMVNYDKLALAKRNIEEMIQATSEKGLLFRCVENTCKGILSTSYKMMDASVVFQSFVKRAVDEGYVPLAGMNTQSRYHLKFVRDNVIEIAGDEIVTGLSIQTSDYGAGANDIEFFIMRVVCQNMMKGFDILHKVHLGSRKEYMFGDDGFVFSDRTQKFDALTLASAVSDVVKAAQQFEPEVLNIVNAANKEIDAKGIIEKLKKTQKLGTEEAKRAQVLYDSPLGYELLPPQKTLWRFANVLSLLAKDEKDDKKLELEALSFDVLKM